MSSVWIAILASAFVWWISTGAILYAVKRAEHGPDDANLRLVVLALPVLVIGGYGYWVTLAGARVADSYLAFLSAIAIWGWFELAFLTGAITGPVTRPCPPGVPEWERFLRAWGTVAYSEIALMLTLVVLCSLAWHAENTIGMWTFIILFFARISAKLNLYLGVSNVNVEFLPKRMAHLSSYFKIARMNWFFPVSVTALTFAIACFAERAVAAPAAGGGRIGFTLLAALTALALVEHWLMVLKLPDAKLWRFLITNAKSGSETSRIHDNRHIREDAHGL